MMSPDCFRTAARPRAPWLVGHQLLPLSLSWNQTQLSTSFVLALITPDWVETKTKFVENFKIPKNPHQHFGAELSYLNDLVPPLMVTKSLCFYQVFFSCCFFRLPVRLICSWLCQ